MKHILDIIYFTITVILCVIAEFVPDDTHSRLFLIWLVASVMYIFKSIDKFAKSVEF